jgi:hypothetical protein
VAAAVESGGRAEAGGGAATAKRSKAAAEARHRSVMAAAPVIKVGRARSVDADGVIAPAGTLPATAKTPTLRDGEGDGASTGGSPGGAAHRPFNAAEAADSLQSYVQEHPGFAAGALGWVVVGAVLFVTAVVVLIFSELRVVLVVRDQDFRRTLRAGGYMEATELVSELEAKEANSQASLPSPPPPGPLAACSLALPALEWSRRAFPPTDLLNPHSVSNLLERAQAARPYIVQGVVIALFCGVICLLKPFCNVLDIIGATLPRRLRHGMHASQTPFIIFFITSFAYFSLSRALAPARAAASGALTRVALARRAPVSVLLHHDSLRGVGHGRDRHLARDGRVLVLHPLLGRTRPRQHRALRPAALHDRQPLSRRPLGSRVTALPRAPAPVAAPAPTAAATRRLAARRAGGIPGPSPHAPRLWARGGSSHHYPPPPPPPSLVLSGHATSLTPY